jgi:hypothetical protein
MEARRRGLVPPCADDDIADPYGRDDEAFDVMARRLATTMDVLVGGQVTTR